MKNKFLRFVSLALIFTLCLSLGACAKRSESGLDDGKPTVVATIFPYYDFVRSLCGGAVNLVMLVPPGTDTHSYEATPKDVSRVHSCDLFIYTGGTEDGQFEELLASAEKPVNTLRLINCVRPLRVLHDVPDGEHEQGHEHAEDEYDPHIWTAPANAKLICEAITQKLGEIIPDFKKETAESYIARLDELDRDYAGYFAAHKKPLIFGDRFPFIYLTDEYGVEYYAAFPGCADYTEPSAKTVRTLISTAKENGVTVIYHTEGANTAAADSIAAEIGGKTALLHSCHRITRDEFNSGISYLSLMVQNLETLRKAD